MNPAPSLQGALWSGNQQLATKRQLISSINGLYADIQDINLSTITVNTVSASTGTVLALGVSTLSFKGFDSLLDLDFSFDLGLGDAVGGLLGGLGGIVGGAFIGLGTGVGLGIQGITNGLFSLANTRGDNYINSNVFETVAGTTQLQISTLGNAYPLYSSIYRSVSSISPNTVPGQEIFLSTFFQPGTTCIRSVSDPLTPLTKDSNINTSTIQSFGEWIPFLDPSVAGEDIYARKAQFSSLTLSNVNSVDYPIFINMSNTNGLQQILSLIDTPPDFVSETIPYSDGAYAYSQIEYPYQHRTNFNRTIDYISTPYNQYTSTIGTYGTPVYFLTSTITNQSTIPKFIYAGNDFGGANIAVCEPDETSFLSTYTLDLVAQSSNVLLQWGLAVDNLNSTIAQGTAKRISWNIDANTSNFIDIPVPQSTIMTYALGGVALQQSPYEARWVGQYTYNGSLPINPNGGMAFAMRQMTFGDTTVFNNQPGYPYQFNGNVYVDGILEVDSLIATSSIVNVSTNIQTFFSTQTFDADEATISSALINFALTSNLTASNGYVSSLQTTFIGGDEISSFGIQTYNALSQFSYVSTLVLDYQMLGNLTPGVIAYLQDIRGSNGARINTTNATFQSLSTVNASTVNLSASNAFIGSLNLNTVGSSNGSFSNLTASNVFTGSNLFAQNLVLSTITTSTLNVNTISTTSHSGSDITCDNITINDFATFPSVGNGSNVISMTFSNTTNSNSYTPLIANITQGSVFPQTSNQFSITTSGSNTTIQDRQGLIFDTVIGDTVVFGSGVETIQVSDGDIKCRGIQYGTLASGYLQPRCFAMSNTTGFGAGTSITASGAITDGTNNFLGTDYNCQIGLRSFAQTNGAVAYNTVIVVPYIDAGTQNWYWSLQADINVGSAGGDGVFSWTVFLFPYNMIT